MILFPGVYQSPLLKLPFWKRPLFANHLKINNQVNITGNGVAPIFSDYLLEFGKRRVGTANDTIIQISNDGNIASELAFKEFILKSQDDKNSSTIEKIKQTINSQNCKR